MVHGRNCSRYFTVIDTKARYWLRIAICDYPTCIRCPVRVIPVIYCHNVWYRELEWCGYRRWKTFEDMFTRQNARTWQTDGPRDRQTDTAWHSIAQQNNQQDDSTSLIKKISNKISIQVTKFNTTLLNCQSNVCNSAQCIRSVDYSKGSGLGAIYIAA